MGKIEGLSVEKWSLGINPVLCGFKGENPPADWTSPATCGLSQGIDPNSKNMISLPAV